LDEHSIKKVKKKMADKVISVLIVDDHTIVREGLKTLLELNSDIRVLGEAADGKSAVEIAGRLQPDVILMDLIMPEMDGIQTTKEIHARYPEMKVIALTSFLEDDKIVPAIQAGATSFLLKDVTPDALVDAIRAAHQGESRLNPQITKKLMEKVTNQLESMESPTADLTEREMEVVRLVAEGLSNKDIAAKLVISEKTVKTHVSSILGKLHLNDRTQLAVYALKNGIV
jgi:NarL family two-component system response regulator LiaR